MPVPPDPSPPTPGRAAPATVPGDPAPPASAPARVAELGGPPGPEPTRFGDWERAGRCIDF